MGHMLPPDDEREDSIGDRMRESNKSYAARFFTKVVILLGIIILVMAVKDYLIKHKTEKSVNSNPYSDSSGGSLGGAMGGAGDDEMPTPESIAREMKGGGMKVMISSPSGDKVIEVSPEQMKAMSKPVGGDETEATPVGGAGGGN